MRPRKRRVVAYLKKALISRHQGSSDETAGGKLRTRPSVGRLRCLRARCLFDGPPVRSSSSSSSSLLRKETHHEGPF